MCDRQIHTYISPSFPEAKLDNPSLDDLIDVFEDRIKKWLLEPAKYLVENETFQVAGFSILLTYFEGIWPYIQGQESKGQSKRFFIEAFADVFRPSCLPEEVIKKTAKVLYDDARCGFFHDGMFRDRIFFKRLDKGELYVTVTKKKIDSILVDSRRFCNAIERHFCRFIATLRNPACIEERTKFNAMCKIRWDWEGEAIYIGMANPPKKK
jgi:hypothetical protein